MKYVWFEARVWLVVANNLGIDWRWNIDKALMMRKTSADFKLDGRLGWGSVRVAC